MLDETQNAYDNNIEPLELSDGFVERIDKRTLTPLNDPNCPHANVTREPSLDIPGTTDVHCNDCNVGWYVR